MKEKTGQEKGRGVQKALEEGENSGEPSIVSGGRRARPSESYVGRW